MQTSAMNLDDFLSAACTALHGQLHVRRTPPSRDADIMASAFDARRTSSTTKGRQRTMGSSTSAIASGTSRAQRHSRAVSVSSGAERADGRGQRRATDLAPNVSISNPGLTPASPTDERSVYRERDVPYSSVQARTARTCLIKLLAAQLVREAFVPKTHVNRLSDGFRKSFARRPVRQIQLRPAASNVNR